MSEQDLSLICDDMKGCLDCKRTNETSEDNIFCKQHTKLMNNYRKNIWLKINITEETNGCVEK